MADIYAANEVFQHVKYTGSNAADVVAALEASAFSESGGVLTVTISGNDYPLESGQLYVCRYTIDGWQVTDAISATYAARRYSTQMAANTAAIAAMQSQMAGFGGAYATPAQVASAVSALKIRQATGTASLATGLSLGGTRSFSLSLDVAVDVGTRPTFEIQGPVVVGGHSVATWSYASVSGGMSSSITGTYASVALASAATLRATVPYLG